MGVDGVETAKDFSRQGNSGGGRNDGRDGIDGAVGGGAVVTLVTLGMLAARDDGLPPISGAGLHVVDGDTVDFDGRRWRLTGYDTPEIYHAHCPRERHRGIVAAARLVALIEAGAVLEPDTGGAAPQLRRRG